MLTSAEESIANEGLRTVSPGLVFPALATPPTLVVSPYTGPPLHSVGGCRKQRGVDGGPHGCCQRHTLTGNHAGSLQLKGNFPSKGRIQLPFIPSLQLFLEPTQHQVVGQLWGQK